MAVLAEDDWRRLTVYRPAWQQSLIADSEASFITAAHEIMRDGCPIVDSIEKLRFCVRAVFRPERPEDV